MRKRLLTTTALLLSLLSSISLWADTEGTLTNSISWTLTDEGVLTIRGEGEMPDFTNNSPWYESEKVTSVIITDGITKLGSRTFVRCKKLTQVSFPSTLKTIGYNAFDQCDFSAGITLPEGLETIENYAFDACSLPSITLPSSLKTLGEDAFANNFIKSVIIPKSVETITGPVFFGANPMEKITVEEGNPKYDSRDNCNAIIETATNTLIEGSNCTVIPNTVTRIANYAFSCCHQLQEITIPESIVSLGNGAFDRCENLKSITFDGTTPPTLGENVFNGVASDFVIKVPRAAYGAYTAATNWNALSENIMASGQRAEYNSDGTIVKLFYDGKPTTEEGWHNVYLEDNFRCYDGDLAINMQNVINKQAYVTVKSIELDESMKNYRPTYCNNMFENLQVLESIKGLEYLNTENVTGMIAMFNYCFLIEKLDLSSFDTKNVTSMNKMFNGCRKLKHIYVSDKFSTDKLVNISQNDNIFYDNDELKYKEGGMKYANYIDGNFEKKVGTLGGEPLGATGEDLTIQELELTDGNDLNITETGNLKIKSGDYGRNITSKWGTLCLPYDIDEQNETCNAKFYTIKSMTSDAITLEEVSSVAAGTPVIFRLKDSSSNVAHIPGKGTLATDPQSSNSLVGTFTTQMVPDNAYFIANDAFRLASDYKKEDGTSGVKVGAYRAYIQPAEGQSLSASTLSIKMGDATAIDDAVFSAIDNGTAEYYDASGKRTDGLHKGLNIVKTGNKTRKIIIK